MTSNEGPGASKRTNDTSRRGLLAATGTSLALGLAGCSSGGESTTTRSESGEATSDGTSNEETGGDGSSDEDLTEPGYADELRSVPSGLADPTYRSYNPDSAGPGTDATTMMREPADEPRSLGDTAIVVDGTTYIVSSFEAIAYDPGLERLWQTDLDLETPSGASNHAVPVYLDDTLVVAASNPPRLVGLNPEDGTREYLETGPTEFEQLHPVGRHDDALLYLAAEEGESALDQVVSLVWYDPTDASEVRRSDSFEDGYTGVDTVMGDGRLYAWDSAISLTDGVEVWETQSDDYTTTLLYSNDVVVRGKASSYTSSVPEELFGLDAETGERLWSTSVSIDNMPVQDVAADDSRIYTRGNTTMRAYDLSDGKQVWEQITASEMSSEFAIGDSNLYVGTTDDKMQVLDTETGERKSRIDVGSLTYSMSVVGDRLYCATRAGQHGEAQFDGDLMVVAAK